MARGAGVIRRRGGHSIRPFLLSLRKAQPYEKPTTKYKHLHNPWRRDRCRGWRNLWTFARFIVGPASRRDLVSCRPRHLLWGRGSRRRWHYGGVCRHREWSRPPDTREKEPCTSRRGIPVHAQ